MFCRHCGKKIEDDSKFCRYCGGSVTVSAGNKEEQGTAVEEGVSVNGVKMSKQDSVEEDETFLETPVESYRKVKLTPAMQRKIEDQKREDAKKDAVNRKLRKAVVRNIMARKKEEEINKTGNTHVDMYKRHLKENK
ncbi:MAG: zinc ribbon domain-containing protein [Candidatus Goldiibacteriota bacterium]